MKTSLKEIGICLYVLSRLEEMWALIEIHMRYTQTVKELQWLLRDNEEWLI